MSAKLKEIGKEYGFKPSSFIEDLIKAVCLICEDGGQYTFTHRSFQEYFTSYFLLQLTDSDLQKAGQFLISEYSRRSADSVLPMVREMNPARFETDVLTPILESVEKSSKQYKDLYCCYIDQVLDGKVFRVIFPNEHIRVYRLQVGLKSLLSENAKSSFLFDYCFSYRWNEHETRSKKDIELQRNALEQFALYLKRLYPIQKSIRFKTTARFTAKLLLRNGKLRSLFEETYLGSRLLAFSHSLQKIKHKNEAKDRKKASQLEYLLSL